MNFRLSALFVLMIINQLSNSMQDQDVSTADQREQRELTEYIRTNNYSGYVEITKSISQKVHNDLHSKFEYLKSYDLINILVDKANKFFSTTIKKPNEMIFTLSISPDSKKIATSTGDYTIDIWDADTGNLIHNLIGHTCYISELSFSPDSTMLATSSEDTTVKIWDVCTGNLIHNITEHTQWVCSIAFNSDGTKLATSSWDGRIIVWDVKNDNNLIFSLNAHFFYKFQSRVKFSPDATKVAINDTNCNAEIWDVRAGNLIHNLIGHTANIYSLLFSPDGQKLATISLDNTAKIWDVCTGKVIVNLNNINNKLIILFSPDNKKFATCYGDIRAMILNIDTGDLIHNLTDHIHSVSSISFSPDGKKFATSSDDKITKIWDVDTGNLMYNLTDITSDACLILFSPNGNKLVIGSASNRERATIWHLDKVYSIEDAFKTLNYEQLELLDNICEAFKKVKDNQYIKLSTEQKAIADSLPACIKVPLKMALKSLLTKLITSQ